MSWHEYKTHPSNWYLPVPPLCCCSWKEPLPHPECRYPHGSMVRRFGWRVWVRLDRWRGFP